ncbi:hypothetical protein [Candidatus Methylobacter favarea]|nr:hypothetical protein [Candidatus Methylobacter favarea]
MKAINSSKVPDPDSSDNLEILCQEFNGDSFYGLEYILDDFFQNKPAKIPVPAHPFVDWFGLLD